MLRLMSVRLVVRDEIEPGVSVSPEAHDVVGQSVCNLVVDLIPQPVQPTVSEPQQCQPTEKDV